MPRHRSIYTDTTKFSVVYKPEISTDLHCLLCMKCPCRPLSCLCFPNVSTKATESAYIHVYPNRLEYNYPSTTMEWNCSCHIVDNVKTIYFDRKQMEEVYALDGCICGYDKTVVLKRPCCSAADVEVDDCCGRVFLPCVEDAPTLVQIVQERKQRRLTELKINVVTTMDRGEPVSMDTGSTLMSREQSALQPKRESIVSVSPVQRDSVSVSETKKIDTENNTITIEKDTNNIVIHFDNEKHPVVTENK